MEISKFYESGNSWWFQPKKKKKKILFRIENLQMLQREKQWNLQTWQWSGGLEQFPIIPQVYFNDLNQTAEYSHVLPPLGSECPVPVTPTDLEGLSSGSCQLSKFLSPAAQSPPIIKKEEPLTSKGQISHKWHLADAQRWQGWEQDK